MRLPLVLMYEHRTFCLRITRRGYYRLIVVNVMNSTSDESHKNAVSFICILILFGPAPTIDSYTLYLYILYTFVKVTLRFEVSSVAY